MTRKRVITERDVRRAKADGKSTIDVGDAVVTPSAREVAATLRIALGEAKAGERAAPPPRRGASRPAQSAPDGGTSRGTKAAGATANATPPRQPPPSPSAKPAAARGQPRPSVAIGADHGGFALKTVIAKRLRELGHDVADVGTNSADPVDYPDFAEAVARMVGEGRATFGVMIDGAGIGSCMAANKVARVRAAMCYDVTTAVNAREHNFANVLTLGAGLLGERLALTIVETFLSTPTGAERHAARVAKIDALDRRG